MIDAIANTLISITGLYAVFIKFNADSAKLCNFAEWFNREHYNILNIDAMAKHAPVVALLGQPAWFYVGRDDWGVMCVSVAWTAVWLIEVAKSWEYIFPRTGKGLGLLLIGIMLVLSVMSIYIDNARILLIFVCALFLAANLKDSRGW